MILTIVGHVPAKKNNLRRSKNGGMYGGKSAELAPLLLQVQSQWKQEPLDWAEVNATFYLPAFRGDLDNKYTTLQDLLVKGGVIAGDTAKRIGYFSCKGLSSAHERVVVEIHGGYNDKKKRKA
jgi:Holliday junction resolvase RusA-like endonuclease